MVVIVEHAVRSSSHLAIPYRLYHPCHPLPTLPSFATVVLSGVYNFSTNSFVIEGKQGLTLAGQNALLLFGYKHNGHHSDEQTGSIQAGVNITNSERTTLKGAAIDYRPKAPVPRSTTALGVARVLVGSHFKVK